MKDEKIVKLNLGCGTDYREGFINVDNSPYIKTDIKFDLDTYPFPFKDNSVDYINCTAVIEHLKDMLKFMEEIHRILKKGGKIRFRVPLAGTFVDYRDPTHKQHIIPNTFDMFMKKETRTITTKAKFKGKIWVTIPFFHNLKFPKKLAFLNSVINNLFTGLEGILIKI